MHSHDQTLLAKLGFADQDRKNPRHDLACQYLGQPEMAQRILSASFPRRAAGAVVTKKKLTSQKEQSYYEYVRLDDEERDARAKYGIRVIDQSVTVTTVSSGVELDEPGVCFERHLRKGEGKYATTVGFLDLVLSGTEVRHETWTEKRQIPEKGRYVHAEGVGRFTTPREYRVDVPAVDTEYPASNCIVTDFTLVIEVKVTPTPASDVIRQLKLYKEHFPRGSGERLAFALVTSYAVDARDREMLGNEHILIFQLGEAFGAWVKTAPDTANAPPAIVL